MAKHLNEYSCIGRLADDVTLQDKDENGKDNAGKVKCYFRIGVGQGTRTNNEGKPEELPTLWWDCCARGTTATYLSKFAHKGDLFYVRGELSKSRNERVINGVKTVYNDVTINVEKVVKCASSSKNKESVSGEESIAAPVEQSGAGMHATAPVEVPPLSEEEELAVSALPI